MIFSQVDVGPIPCQELDNLEMTLLSCTVKRRNSFLIHLIHISSSLNKTLSNLKKALKRCTVQGCPSLLSFPLVLMYGLMQDLDQPHE